MPARFVTLRRRFYRVAPAVLLPIALAAYAASLYQGHLALPHGAREIVWSQRFGSAASASGARASDTNRDSGNRYLHAGSARVATARWQLDALQPGAPSGTLVTSRELFVAGDDLRFDRSTGYAVLLLNERSVATVRPGPGQFPDARSAGPDVPAQVIDIPPGLRRGFRFETPVGDDCLARACSVGIELHDGRWGVESIGLRYATRPPAARPLWATSSWPWVISLALATAALSHFALSALRGRLARRPASRWLRP